MNKLLTGLLAPLILLAPFNATADDSPVISAGLGDAMLPAIASFAFCRGIALSEGFGGMPVVLSKPVDNLGGFMGDPNALDPSLFQVKVGKRSGLVQPICATLAPAVDPAERRTVLLIGEFGLGGDNGPIALRVKGDLTATDGTSLRGARTLDVGEVNGGPSLVLAEVFAPGEVSTSQPDDGTRNRFCPSDGTTQIVKLTFSGGVSGPNGGALADDPTAMAGIEIMGVAANGMRRVLHPTALRDDDMDNHLDVCLGTESEGLRLIRAQVNSHTFYAPQNVPGRAITVSIQQP
ncbi:MAG: hypothetical protein AAF004_02670 [Pseudomonadota bacterium]